MIYISHLKFLLNYFLNTFELIQKGIFLKQFYSKTISRQIRIQRSYNIESESSHKYMSILQNIEN